MPGTLGAPRDSSRRKPLARRSRKVVGIDGEAGKGRPQAEQRAHGVRCRVPLRDSARRPRRRLLQPGAQGLVWRAVLGAARVPSHARACRRRRSGHGHRARRASPRAMPAKPSVRLANTGSGMPGSHHKQKRAQTFQALAGAVHAAMPLGRGREARHGRARARAKRHAPHCLAHRHRRVETVTQARL